jgi:hypothetical protein
MKYYHNLQRTYEFEYSEHEFPIVYGDDIKPKNLLAFNTADRINFDGTCHFFMHDYKQERIWSRPDKYINYLKKFEAVIMPDFSMYEDAPTPIAIYNKFRNHWLANYFQSEGIKVIVNPQWMTGIEFGILFEGLYANTIAKSSIGCLQRNSSRDIYIQGFEAMLKLLDPKTIIHYGKIPHELELENSYDVIQFDDHATLNRGKWNGK